MNTRICRPGLGLTTACLLTAVVTAWAQDGKEEGQGSALEAFSSATPMPYAGEHATSEHSQQRRADEFAHLKRLARTNGSVPVIVEVDVPNIGLLIAASRAAKGPAKVAQADARLAQAVDAAARREIGRLAAAPHQVNRIFQSIPFMALNVSEQALSALEQSPAVVDINEDRLEAPMLDTTVHITGASTAWAEGFDGSGWYVAVLDTGLRNTHEFFAGKDIVEACFALGQDGTAGAGDCPNGQSTDFGPGSAAHHATPPNSAHGTHVAGIAVGNGPGGAGKPDAGIARGADLIAIQVFSQFFDSPSCGGGDCVLAFNSDTTAALEYVYSIRDTYPIASANMSLGGGIFNSPSICDDNNASRKAAIDNLRSIGAATAIASGNEGSCSGISSPGCISTAIAVGAVNDSDAEAGFSNYWPSLLDLYAQGVNVLSSVSSSDSAYQSSGWSGTSMATPHVAGAWAVLRQAQPAASVDEIFDLLDATGQPVTGRCETPAQRRIQIDAALNELRAVQSCDPQKLTASDGTASDEFGYAVAMSGPMAAVGSRLDDENGAGAGAVYVYTRNGTTFDSETKLVGTDTAAADEFGTALAAENDLLLVGAPGHTHSSLAAAGAAYVFRWNGSTWTQEAKLTATDPGANDRFGRAVALSGNVALIGAFADDGGAEDAGSAYVFRFNGSTWQFEQKLTAFDPGTFDNFGRAVAASGNVIAVAAPNNDGAASGGGAVYMYRWDGSTWGLDGKLTSSDAATSDRFGHSVAVSGDDLLIGSQNDDDVESNAGSAYYFAWNGSSWVEQQQIYAPDPAATDQFGQDVRLAGDLAIVAAPLHEHSVNNAGAVFTYRRGPTGWTFSTELLTPDAAELDQLGYALGYDEGIILAGARWHDGNAQLNAGAAYLLPVGDCDATFVADLCEIQVDPALDQNNNGLLDTCECPVATTPVLAKLQTPSGTPDVVMNRFLPVRAGDPGQQQKIQVTAVQLPSPFDPWNGQVWWAGTPHRVCEKAGETGGTSCSPVPGQPKGRLYNWYAPLVCDEQSAAEIDWHGQCDGSVCISGLEAGQPCVTDADCQVDVMLYTEGVVPGARNVDAIYEVRLVNALCDTSDPESFSPALTVTQKKVGNLVGLDITQCQPAPPDDAVGLPDVNALLQKFANVTCQIKKARGDLRGSLSGRVDFRVDLSDINAALAGFTNPVALPWSPVDVGDPCHLGQ